MIKDITIGQYFPGNSFIHKMDARMKIILIVILIASIFVCKNIISLATIILATVILVAISRIAPKTILKSIKPLAIIIIITAVLNIFYGTGEPIYQLGFLKITQNGINNAVFVTVRIICLIIISSSLTFTTSPTDLTDAIERLMKLIPVHGKHWLFNTNRRIVWIRNFKTQPSIITELIECKTA